MKKTREILSLITLVVFICSNFLDSFSYIFAEDVIEAVSIQSLAEVTE